jgi:hypothetical protein
MVKEVVERLPAKENFYDRSIQDAFSVLAERDLASARNLAEELDSPNQQDALAGVAEIWARGDLDGAIAWAKDVGVHSNEVVRSALIGIASVNPVAALERISSVPPGGRESHGNSTTGARILEVSARTDFEGTVLWLKANPGGLSREDLLGLRGTVTEKLLADQVAFLTQHANNGVLPALVDAIGSALMNRAAGVRPVVWEWLNNQPPNDSINALRKSVLNSSAWQDPDFALELVRDLPSTAQGDADVKEVARALMNGGRELQRFERLYAVAPERLRAPLVEQAFHHLSPDYMQDPQSWLARVSLLPAEKQVDGIASVARAWARQTPEEAALWAMSQPIGPGRSAAIAKIASTWAASDHTAARDWLEILPRDDRSAAETAIKMGKR